MAKARANRATKKPQSPLWVLQHIDSVQPEELDALAHRLARHTKKEFMRDFLALALKDLQLQTERLKIACLNELIAEAKNAEKVVNVLRKSVNLTSRLLEKCRQAEVRWARSKRKMAQARIETAEAYLELEKMYPKQIRALRALVNLPEEQSKTYAVAYRRSRDEEALRQYIKSLMRTYRKYKNWLDSAKVWEAGLQDLGS
jgi:hypothetical protein